MSEKLSRTTRVVRTAVGTDTAHGAVMPPVYLSTNFAFDGYEGKRCYDYTRSGNPTRDALAEALTALDGGAAATVTSSGMAAIDLVCHLLGPEDLLVAPHDCYGGTYRLLDALARKRHFRVAFVDQSDSAALCEAFSRRPRMILVETPSNPLLRITDISVVSRLAKQTGTLVVADNTFLSPVLQRPLEHGADAVLYSTTKYLNGHSDVVGGAVISKTADLAEEIGWWANALGVTGAPFDSYLTLRGLRTLELRIRQHEQNAAAIVELLEAHPTVRRVYYPGLASHPGHTLAARQQDGYGAMVSFELDGGTPQVRVLLERLRCYSLAESLGGVESLIAHPATMTHAAMDPEARRRAGIGDTLLRLSVGIEAAEDLVADLAAGLDRAAASRPAMARSAGE